MASLTQYRDNLAQWWVQDKISGTILPILIVLNLRKFSMGEDPYTFTELIANAFMLGISMISIAGYTKRKERESKRKHEYNLKLEELATKKAMNDGEIALKQDMFEQKRAIENFAMDVTKKQKEHQFKVLLTEVDVIDKQIAHHTKQIVYISQHFDKNQEGVKELMQTHFDDIEHLREYKKKIPDMMALSFTNFSNAEKKETAEPVPVPVSSELDEVLKQIVDNINEDTLV